MIHVTGLNWLAAPDRDIHLDMLVLTFTMYYYANDKKYEI